MKLTALSKMPNIITESLKLGRIEFAGLLFANMIIGALCIKGRSLEIGQTFPLMAIAVSANIWGFAHNDFLDFTTDRRAAHLQERPLVKGTISRTFTILLILLCVIVGLSVTLIYSGTPIVFAIAVSAFFLAGLYNYTSKKIGGSDFFFAASTALVSVLGGMLVADPWRANSLFYVAITALFFDNLAFNAGASLKDVKNDRRCRSTTAAICFKVKAFEDDRLIIPKSFKAAIITLKMISVALLAALIFFSRLEATLVQSGTFFLAAVFSMGVTVHALNIDRFDRYLIGKRWAQHEAATRLLLPIALYNHIGPIWTLTILLLPLIWFLTANKLTYGKFMLLHRGF